MIVPIPSGRLLGNRQVLEEMQYDRNALREQSLSLRGRLNEDQLVMYEEVIDSVRSPEGA